MANRNYLLVLKATQSHQCNANCVEVISFLGKHGHQKLSLFVRKGNFLQFDTEIEMDAKTCLLSLQLVAVVKLCAELPQEVILFSVLAALPATRVLVL